MNEALRFVKSHHGKDYIIDVGSCSCRCADVEYRVRDTIQTTKYFRGMENQTIIKSIVVSAKCPKCHVQFTVTPKGE